MKGSSKHETDLVNKIRLGILKMKFEQKYVDMINDGSNIYSVIDQFIEENKEEIIKKVEELSVMELADLV